MPVIALFSLSLLWGSTFYFTKMLLPDFHPVSIVFYRCVFGAIALLPFFLWKRQRNDLKIIPVLLGITLLNAGLPWILMSFSLKNLDTTLGSVLNATGPIFGILLSWAVLKVTVSRQEILSVLVGFTGIAIAFIMGSSISNDFQFSSAVLLLCGVNIYAMSAVLTAKFLHDCSVFTLSFMAMVVGSSFSGIFMIGVEPTCYQALFNTKSIFLFVMLGMFNSGFGNVIFYYLIKKDGAVFALMIT